MKIKPLKSNNMKIEIYNINKKTCSMYINIYEIYNDMYSKNIKHMLNILTFVTFQQPHVAEEDSCYKSKNNYGV